jgi:hypothetical protein
MTISLKPTDELIVSATGIAIVYAIFNGSTPNLADVRADQKGNTNTHAATKMAAITSIAAIGALSLVGKSPTVFTVGGAMILFETWKMHFANYGKDGTQDNPATTAY